MEKIVYTRLLEVNLPHYMSLQTQTAMKWNHHAMCRVFGQHFCDLSAQEKGHVFIVLCHLINFGAYAHPVQA